MSNTTTSQKTTATGLEELPGTATVEPVVASDGELDWDGEFDVIVVGLGAAGVSAAIEARDLGAEVAFIDRFEGGGTTARSGSVIYAGGGTSLQKKLGVEDSPGDMFNYLKNEVQGVVSDETLERFCKESPANFDFVTGNGVTYSGELFAKKASYPVHGISLYYSGNEIACEEEGARAAPRGHLADGIKRFTAFGPAFIGPLIRSALKKGVTPIRKTRVTRLVVNSAGEVTGLEGTQVPSSGLVGLRHKILSTLASYAQIYFAPAAKSLRPKLFAIEKQHGKTVRYRARGGVVLSTGGYILNKELTDRYLPKYARAMKLGTTGDTGDGHALGVSAGGVAERMSTATAWRFINPPAEWPRAIIVNSKGERYVNESLYGAVIGTRMMEENNGEAILVMDKKLFDASVESLNLKNARLVTIIQAKTAIRAAKSAATIAELAVKCKIDAEKLQQTVNEYNACARGDKQDPMGKSPADIQEISDGPFYAINMSVGKGDITSVISLGGLKVCEETGLVLQEGGEPVKGLYAAGRTAIGVASNAYVSGLSIADGVFSGRRAGKSAADAAKG